MTTGKETPSTSRAPMPTAACPFSRQSFGTAPNGCPVSDQAAAFDPFELKYQLDPAECLRWSRENEPVFFSPKLNYYVVSRFDDIQNIFRDNVTFSPSIALEKVTPSTPEAQQILQSYNYGMSRTLVNEDEPAHMERRRILMESFNPEELVDYEPMVRSLTRQYVDRFIDKGHADLVDDMLWEVTLNVALHFLGVPEADMAKLREYSIAHTVNVWGRPTPEQQIEISHKVGKFWQLAGNVLQKMRETPDEYGWMRYAIRRQKDYPEVVTDSFLHSMMMAIIVAAHETSAHASANAFLALLRDRRSWEELCTNPGLIPNAVEECLRLSGSVAAWRRIATKDTYVGDVFIPAGSKLLMVSASGNHDPRHFDNPDELDIYRENTTDHLTFGYGSHQCMGKNIARMEMRVFVEELTRRLPHMELVPEQTISYVPTTSFRGPDHVYVRWDPTKNPERRSPIALEPKLKFSVGAPSKKEIARTVRVSALKTEADQIISLTLSSKARAELPQWSAGAHVDLLIGEDIVRRYSLCGKPGDPDWQIAVLREKNSRGGSAFIHDELKIGMDIKVRGPKNHFRLDEDSAGHFVLVAGGIGITPIMAMADRLKEVGKSYELHYCGRSSRSMAFLDRLSRDHSVSLHLYPSDESIRLDVSALVRRLSVNDHIYACGPEKLLGSFSAAMQGQEEQLHTELFTTTSQQRGTGHNEEFDVLLQDSDITLHVDANQTLLEALRTIGTDLQSDCEEGLCGSCQVGVVSGDIEHRDYVLTQQERKAGDKMLACCSRGSGRLVLRL